MLFLPTTREALLAAVGRAVWEVIEPQTVALAASGTGTNPFTAPSSKASTVPVPSYMRQAYAEAVRTLPVTNSAPAAQPV